MNRKGFTLLEVLVATTIMGVAVVGLLSALSTSVRNAARLTDYDRAVILAKSKMDALLLDSRLPLFSVMAGEFDQATIGGMRGGWRARLTPFETPPNPAAGSGTLERLELEIWWMPGDIRRTFTLEGFRRKTIRPEDLAAYGGPH